MAQPFVEPCDRGIIAAQPCPRALGREIAPWRRRVVLAACVLASAMTFIDGSALADHYGKARMLAVVCIGFGLSSAACVAAPSIEWLIVCRVAQGISAAI